MLRGDLRGGLPLVALGYPAGIQEHVKQVTAPYKYPREVEFVGELSKNASGKLLRRVLRER